MSGDEDDASASGAQGNDAQYPSRSSMTVTSTPLRLFTSLKSGPGYMLGRPLPFAYSRRLTTAETPPYAQPTTRTRCGDDSDRLPIVSVMLAIFILKDSGLVKMRGRIERRWQWWWQWWEVEDDLIRLTRTGGHWRFIDSHTSHRYRRRPALDWDRRNALGQSHHTSGEVDASLVRYVDDRVILIRSAANFIRSAASVHWRGAVDWPAVDASGGLSHFWQALSKHRGRCIFCLQTPGISSAVVLASLRQSFLASCSSSQSYVSKSIKTPSNNTNRHLIHTLTNQSPTITMSIIFRSLSRLF
jgi:hypothetical protein